MTDEKAIEKMVYDQQQGWPLCPRCGERMPDKLTHGALSRHANGVYICEACGTDEALRDWGGNVKPLSDWVLVRIYTGLSEKTQRKVLDELTRCFDDVSVEDAAQMKF